MKVFLAPKLTHSIGGPSSFQNHFINYLSSIECSFTFDLCEDIQSALLINGSRNILELLYLWFKGVPMVIRLGSKYRSNLFESPYLAARLNYLPKYLLILFGIILSKAIVFQSYTVRKEWSSNPLIRFKKNYVIYNPSISSGEIHDFSYTNSLLLNSSLSNSFDLIAVEAHHHSPAYSFPLSIFNYLKSNGYTLNLHVFGKVPDSWYNFINSESCSLKIYGFLSHSQLIKELKNIQYPIYLPSDIFPCGCPNSMIEMLSLGIPTITYDNTAGAELVKISGGGLLLPRFYSNPRSLVFPSFEVIPSKISSILQNYIDFSCSAKSLKNHLSIDNTLSRYAELLI